MKSSAKYKSRELKLALLDSNIWRYAVDAEAQGALLRAAREGHYAIQISPAVVYEALRLRDLPLRNRLISLMTNRRFRRLMPEAYSESMEILGEIRRLRPDWLRPNPDSTFFARSRNDWSRKMGGFWVRCAESPNDEAQRVQQMEGSLLKQASEQIRGARKQMMESGWKSNPPMDKTFAALPNPVPGWNGEMVEAWRIESWAGLTYALSRQGNPYRDWISPFVEVDHGLLKSPGWVEFWLHSTNAKALPRQWMRWGHSMAQRFRRVTNGSGGDNQLFTYLLETDMVITSDKGFVDILEECRPFAPCPLPTGHLVPAGAPGIEAMLSILQDP
ncbi:hypothetical protein LB561_09905 [Mesorhizobium sp. B292B1B]|uniref:hypothetical protein n=1 Tax=unclassified Mesorhizobium TaxID=325217 RepID=UPI00112BC11B|nr:MULTISPECIES: hypothetical protein [unclassified Mesorhizobium]MCA0012893.1 hypothetical protein [Mesorhizobium sp. B294B1A1]MCA0037606.1 hypothetical protein [Mesorhizobium sp. B292B1B]TPM50711.1 hypothetical protein FJ964_03070 [Mesorhizobium sp. B2-3-2]